MARATRHAEPRLAIKRRRRESVEITPELERLVCEMYRDDQPVDKIQAVTGVGQYRMYQIVDMHGIPRRGGGRQKGRPEAVVEMCALCGYRPPEEDRVLCLWCGIEAEEKRERLLRRWRDARMA